MPNLHKIKEILKDQNLAPKKRFGQNFLIHEQTIETILDRAAPGKEDIIVEFGVGLGSLTLPLARRVKKVIGIEIDAGIVRWHREQNTLPDNVELIHQDLLKSDFSKLASSTGGPLKIIANLPYSISNPVIFKLIEDIEYIHSATLMLQKEVADRLCASPRTKAYGVLSVILGTCAEIKPLLKIGPGQFHPRPKVDSVVVKISFLPVSDRVKCLPLFERKIFTTIVKNAFQQRRKTLLNALSSASINNTTKADVIEILHGAGIEQSIRPDQLSPEQYIQIAQSYSTHSSSSHNV
nr:ribosomal RNA small subunit methyltransferase A [Desulfobulbaceae bacterium]